MIANPKEGVLNWLASMDPSRREILVATFALMIVIATGTVGYMWVHVGT